MSLAHVWLRHRLAGKAWAAVVYGLSPVLGMPSVARAIANRLTTFHPGAVVDSDAISTLVIFDGDNRRGRVREALRILGLADTCDVVVLGEEWIANALAAAGVPRERIARDASPGNTRKQVAWVARRLASQPDSRPAIVASRLQMPRIALLSRAMGVAPILLPSAVDDEPPTAGWRPNYLALRVSRDALYEHVALAYYRWKRWV